MPSNLFKNRVYRFHSSTILYLFSAFSFYPPAWRAKGATCRCSASSPSHLSGRHHGYAYFAVLRA